MKLGTVTYNIAKDWDLDTLLQICQKTGLEGVELRTTHAHGVEPSLGKQERADVRAKFADSGVTLWGLGTICEYHSADPAEVRRNVELSRDFVELAADVGAVGVKVRPNGFPDDPSVSREQTLEQIGTALREVGRIAEDFGIEVWLEVHGPETSHPPYIKTILDVADHPSVGACWNSNDTDLVDGRISPHFEMLADRIRSAHIRDLIVDYPFAELIGLLKGIGYDRFCLLEIPESPEPERLLKYIVALWKAWTT